MFTRRSARNRARLTEESAFFFFFLRVQTKGESSRKIYWTRDRIDITDTGEIPIFLGHYSITFDEMVRIPI